MKIDIIELQQHGDDRGLLVALEDFNNIPFEIKRVYYMYATKAGVRRGFHSHKKLRQMAICIKGKCIFHLDNGHETTEVELNNPAQGLLIEPGIWHEMYDFTEDCILVVLASEHYNENDYIRNYSEFIEDVNGISNSQA